VDGIRVSGGLIVNVSAFEVKPPPLLQVRLTFDVRVTLTEPGEEISEANIVVEAEVLMGVAVV